MVKNYAAVKEANAKLPILVREADGTAAKLTATYGAPGARRHRTAQPRARVRAPRSVLRPY